MRGLKQTDFESKNNEKESHLLQMRGLKLIFPSGICLNAGSVASFTDAWIETDNAIKMSGLEVSHLLQMRGLKPQRF